MIIEGVCYWNKLDKLRDNYNKQRKLLNKETGEPDGWGREWSVVVGNLSKDTKVALKEAGLLGRVKNKMDDAEDFITFRTSEFKRDGEANKPINVVNSKGQPWDWKTDGLIGNGSKVVAKFNVWKPGNGNASAFLVSLMVKELVPYVQEDNGNSYEDPDDWGAYVGKSEPEVKPKKKAPPVDDDLDDEDSIPF